MTLFFSFDFIQSEAKKKAGGLRALPGSEDFLPTIPHALRPKEQRMTVGQKTKGK